MKILVTGSKGVVGKILVEKLKKNNVSILYISHKMADIKRLSDKVIALRDGKITGTFTKPINYNNAIASMLGKELANIDFLQKQKGDKIIEFKDFKLSYSSKKFDLSIYKGQITALTGLIGTGKSEFMECIFGCLLYTSPSPRDGLLSRMPSSA